MPEPATIDANPPELAISTARPLTLVEPLHETAAESRAKLDRSLVHGIAWTSAVTWFGQVMTWGSTLFVVHRLLPEDYGLIGMATLYLGFLSMASDLGVGAAVVRFRDLTREQIAQFNSLAVFAGAACVLLSFGAAFPLGHFFSEPRLPAVVAVMSASYLITAFRVVPHASLQGRLDFRGLALIDAAVAIAGAGASIAMAVAGFGYWTLALTPIVSATVLGVLVVARNPISFRRPVLASVRQPLMFSGHTLLARLMWFTFSNADFFVIGRFLGKTALGAYTLGWVLSGIAVEKVTALIGRVSPAFFSSVQDDRSELRRYLLLLTQALSLLTFPAAVGMALIANDLVHVVLGDKWTAAVAPLRYLAILATWRSIQPLIPQVLSALGEARLNLQNGVMTVCILPIAFYFATRWGITGVAVTWLALSPVLFLPLFLQARRRIDLSIREYLASLWPAASSCAAMALAIGVLGWALPAFQVGYVALLLKVLVGAVVYVTTLLIFHRTRLSTLRDILRLLRNRAPQPAAKRPDVIVGALVTELSPS